MPSATEQKILAFNPIGHALLKQRQRGRGGAAMKRRLTLHKRMSTHIQCTKKKNKKNGGEKKKNPARRRDDSPRLTCDTQSRGRATRRGKNTNASCQAGGFIDPRAPLRGRLRPGCCPLQSLLHSYTPRAPCPSSSFRSPALRMRGLLIASDKRGSKTRARPHVPSDSTALLIVRLRVFGVFLRRRVLGQKQK